MTREQQRSFTIAACAIFAVAFAVRLWHVWGMHDTPFFSVLMGDARGYDTWARQIAAGDWIGRDVFYQAPFYPYFVGTVYTLFGTDLWALRIAQAIVGSASCVLLAYAGLRWFSRSVGIAAGLALALYAPAIFFDGIIQKSVLDVFFVCAALALLGRLDAGGSLDPPVWPTTLLGVVAGCLSLTRENALLLVPVIATWLWWRTPASASPGARHRGVTLAWFTLGLAIALGPVAARNYAVGGGLYLTTSQFGSNFYIGNNPEADGTYMSLRFGRGSPEYERLDATELAERALQRTLTPAEVSAYWTDRALAFIRSQPGQWIRLEARKAALLINATEMVDTESQEAHAEYSWPLWILSPVTHFGVLVPLATLGFVLTWQGWRRLWILYAIALTYAVSTVMFFVMARYRYPLVPVLLLFAVAGFVRVWELASSSPPSLAGRSRELWRTSKPSFALLIALPALVAVAANWPMLSVARMRAITETNLGTALQEAGRPAEAIDRYTKALAIQPDYVPAYNNLGVTLRAQGRTSEAIEAYQQGLRLRGDYADLHFNLANALMAEGRTGEAAVHLRDASAEMPDSAGVHNNLGMALAERGQVAEAVKEFEAALALEPGSVQALRNLGNVLPRLNRRDEAMAYLRRAIEIAPRDADARYDLGSLLIEAGRFAEATVELRAAVDIRPDYVEARNNLGIALASQGLLKDASVQWEEALRIRPDFADARRNLELARKTIGK